MNVHHLSGVSIAIISSTFIVIDNIWSTAFPAFRGHAADFQFLQVKYLITAAVNKTEELLTCSHSNGGENQTRWISSVALGRPSARVVHSSSLSHHGHVICDLSIIFPVKAAAYFISSCCSHPFTIWSSTWVAGDQDCLLQCLLLAHELK